MRDWASWRILGDCHDRTVAFRFNDLDGADPVPAAADVDFFYNGLHCWLSQFERQTPLVVAALQAGPVKPRQGLQIAGQCRPDAPDESPDDGIVLQHQRAAMVPVSMLNGELVLLQRQ